MRADNSFTRWLLFDGDRTVLAALVLTGVFGLLVALGAADVIALRDSDAVDTVAGGLVPGLFTFLSIVLGINQLVLSQSSGSADQVRGRVAEVREFRETIERRSGTAPAPLVPTDFLAVVVETVAAKADTLRSVAEGGDSEAGAAAVAYARAVSEAATRAGGRVSRADPGRVNAVISLLEYDDAGQIYEARRLLADRGEELSPAARQTLEDLVEILELFDVARTHFRTTYTQRTLARLSRTLLYVGFPAILATFVLGLSTFAAVDGLGQVVLVSALLTVALSPLAVLSSYILRVAAVSERTIGVGPFVSRPGAEEAPFPAGPSSTDRPHGRSREDGPAGDESRTDRSHVRDSHEE